ncbi:hypothetical protein [Microbacterium sp. YJN-G]|uniref:hypothetical protein n=1 Tax=Microbacterium sp. YJN-G TaxID=2763257 RepID=UPI0018789123|nr:hypothetical protein [Microbacterium sp. YJN-G]
MNRYAAAGISIDASAGKRIIVVTPIMGMIRSAMDEIIRSLDGVDPDSFRVRRANGAERIDFPSGGSIRFHSARSSMRGMSANVVYLDDNADREMTDAWRDLYAVTHPNGEIIRA